MRTRARGGTLAVVVILIALSLPSSFEAAFAHTVKCTGSGSMTLGIATGDFPRRNPVSTTFTATLASATCVGASSLAMTGVFLGYCNGATGSGTTNFGKNFKFSVSGTTMTFAGVDGASGAVTGLMSFVPDLVAGSNCLLSPWATRFLIAGSISWAHP